MAEKLSTYTNSHDNNFNLIRFVAATMVLVSHSYHISHVSQKTFHPYAQYFGLSLGIVGVDIFFVISGFLVTGSLLHRKNVFLFLWARFLRIYPALCVAVIFSVLVGVYFTSLPVGGFFKHEHVLTFVWRNITLLLDGIQYHLPGVFDDNPRRAVNGSLWTLPWELKMYLLLLAVGVFTFVAPPLITEQKMKYLFFFATVISTALLFMNRFYPFVDSVHVKPAFRFVSLFFSGASLYVCREKILLSHRFLILILICISMVVGNAKAYYVIHYLTIGYVVLYLAYKPTILVREFNRLGDYSYGMYIYAFPVTQSIIALYPNLEGGYIALYSFVFTLISAVLSWHLLEKKMLNMKNIDFSRFEFLFFKKYLSKDIIHQKNKC